MEGTRPARSRWVAGCFHRGRPAQAAVVVVASRAGGGEAVELSDWLHA